MLSAFLFGCHHRKVGVIDIIDNGICAIQFDDNTTIQVKVSECKSLKEGDAVKIIVSNEESD